MSVPSGPVIAVGKQVTSMLSRDRVESVSHKLQSVSGRISERLYAIWLNLLSFLLGNATVPLEPATLPCCWFSLRYRNLRFLSPPAERW
jgi:hypothetical protein